MGQLTRSFDWANTIIGHPDTWSQSLLNTVGIILNSRFPMFLWWGPGLIQFYNDAYRPSLGRDGKHPDALGQKGEDCWQEIWPVIKPLIDQVLSGGESTWSEDQLIPIYRNGVIEDVYWTFSYSKVIDESEKPAGVLVICNETTGKVQAFTALQEAKQELEIAKAEIENQRDRLKRFFMQAPAGICILDGPGLVFELVNPAYQQLLPGRNLIGRPIFEALPELTNQTVGKVLRHTYQTGQLYEAQELYIPVARVTNGPLEDRYFNFVYQPRRNAEGNIDGIVVFVYEVTEMVVFRKELEKEQDKFKMAAIAAELGTFDMDVIEGNMFWDARCRTLFGISHNDPVTYENDFVSGLHPDDRDRVVEVIRNVFLKSVSNGEYDVEYRTIGVEDHKLRWIRAKGKAYFDKDNKPYRFIGSVLEITEQKQDELRKNDFIGMVSHELKTPLTSIYSYIQLLHARAIKDNDKFSTDTLARAILQVKKMTALINGFLNISRLESSKIHLNKKEFNLNRLIEEVTEEITLTLPSHLIIFNPGEPVLICADHDKIASVLSNLLSNAVKYSQKEKTIYVACEVVNNTVQVSVRDEGPGIGPNDVERLFERFYRVETTENSHISGFGIGLYLCAEIIQRHEGRIWVESEIGKGSTFYFNLSLINR